jgi:hypothetical protein
MGRSRQVVKMSADEAGLREAARGGQEDVDLLAWADRLEERGREQAAGALRGLPGLAEALEEATKRYIGSCLGQRHHLDFELCLFAARPLGGWGCGCRWAYGPDDKFERSAAGAARWPGWHTQAGTHPAVNPLFDHWAELHPAAEWLARRLGREVVQSRCAPFNSLRGRRTCDLAGGQRLRPPEPGRPVRMCRLSLSAAG